MEEIKKIFKKVKWDSIIISLLTIALGVLCVVLPSSSANILCIIFGSSLILMGITMFVRFFGFQSFLGEHILIVGIIMIISGIFFIIYPNTIQNILTVLFGVFIVIDSASSLTDSIYCAKAHINGWWLLFILSIISIGLGVAVIFSTFETVMIFTGIVLIFEGFRRFLMTLFYSHKIKEAKKFINNLD